MGSEIVFLMLGLLVVLILLGTHIGISLGLVSCLGVFLILDDWEAALSIVSGTAYDAVRNQVFAVIPLFVLMGDMVSKSGAATDLYRLCDRALSKLPGRMAERFAAVELKMQIHLRIVEQLLLAYSRKLRQIDVLLVCT